MRRVFVTGAGHGIGRAIVEAFTEAGDRVAFCDIDTTRGEEVAAATGARFFALDAEVGEYRVKDVVGGDFARYLFIFWR